MRIVFRLPAEQPRRADVVVKPIGDHHCLRRLTARLRKSKPKNCWVRFFEGHFRGGETDRDERHWPPHRQPFLCSSGLIRDNPDPVAARQRPKSWFGTLVWCLQLFLVPGFSLDQFTAFGIIYQFFNSSGNEAGCKLLLRLPEGASDLLDRPAPIISFERADELSIRHSVAVSSMISVFPRWKKSRRASCTAGLYHAHDDDDGFAAPVDDERRGSQGHGTNSAPSCMTDLTVGIHLPALGPGLNAC